MKRVCKLSFCAAALAVGLCGCAHEHEHRHHDHDRDDHDDHHHGWNEHHEGWREHHQAVGSAPGTITGSANSDSTVLQPRLSEPLRTETVTPGIGSALFPDPYWR